MTNAKRLRSTLALAAILLSTASSAIAAKTKHVSPAEFSALIGSGEGIILDVRTPKEVEKGWIGDASVIDFYGDDFKRKVALMSKETPIYVYCRSGGRSAEAASIMERLGFADIYNLDGGITAWQSAGNPIVASAVSKNAIEPPPSFDPATFREKLNTDLPVLVDFHTSWCSPCKRMKPVIDALEQELEGKAIILRIDADANAELAETYSITGVPVFIVFDKGEEIWRHSGIVDQSILKENLIR